MQKRLLIGAALWMALTGVAAAAETAPSPEAIHQQIDQKVGLLPPDKDPLTASEVACLFHGNRVQADALLDHKLFWIDGEVCRIDKDADGIAYVALKGTRNEEFPLPEIRCSFIKAREISLQHLHIGDHLRLKGACASTTVFGDVIMLGCRLQSDTSK